MIIVIKYTKLLHFIKLPGNSSFYYSIDKTNTTRYAT